MNDRTHFTAIALPTSTHFTEITMQDFLTAAATATEIAAALFLSVSFLRHAWTRTTPIPAPVAVPTPVATVEPEAPASLPALFAQVDAIMANPLYAADVPATPVKLYRKPKVSPPVQEVIDPCPKPKRGRPPKAKAA